MTGTPLSLVGARFVRLLVISRGGNDPHGHVLWLCACSCGATVQVRGQSLLAGLTKSCGCLRSGLARERVRRLSRGEHQRWQP